MTEVKKMTKKGLVLRVASVACLAAIAGSAIGLGSFAKYQQNIGIAGTDGNDGSKNPRVAEFFFTGDVSKNGGQAFTTDELAQGISLFDSAYLGATGLGTEKGTAGTTVEAVNTDKVVAPGTHGGIDLLMEAGDAADGKSHAETNALVKLNVSQSSGSETASTVPLIYGIDTDGDSTNGINGDDAFYSDVLTTGTQYTINDPTGLGGDAVTPVQITITGDLEDLAATKVAYYKANGNMFYADAAFTTPTNAGTALEGKFDANIHWYWAYEITGANAGDAVDTGLAEQAHVGLHGDDNATDAQIAAAKAAADIKIAVYASATQLD
jgi:hypothetical protein